MKYLHRFLELFQKCLQARRGKKKERKEKSTTQSNGEDPRTKDQVDEEAKIIVNEASELCGRKLSNTTPALEKISQPLTEAKIDTTGIGFEGEEASEPCGRKFSNTTPALEKISQPLTEAKIDTTGIGFEGEEIERGEESGSLPGKASKVDERFQVKIEESGESNSMEDFDSQDEEYKWEISCCGVDIPVTE